MREKVIEIIRKVNPEILYYTGKDLVEDGIIDSLEIMEIASELESEFQFELNAEDVEPEFFMTMESIIELVNCKLKKI